MYKLVEFKEHIKLALDCFPLFQYRSLQNKTI